MILDLVKQLLKWLSQPDIADRVTDALVGISIIAAAAADAVSVALAAIAAAVLLTADAYVAIRKSRDEKEEE